jgi:hypothetical protein
MNLKNSCLIVILGLSCLIGFAQEKRGATIPWTTYEAEKMNTTGTVLGPAYEPFRVETESSGQMCVKLNKKGQYIEFTASGNANSMVIRYSLPDSKDGKGKGSSLAISNNGNLIRHPKISSYLSWLYGKYPFTNDPSAAQPRHFYDEVRMTGLKIKKGDLIRIQRDDPKEDDIAYCIIDLVDLENVGPPLKAPANSLTVTDKGFRGPGTADDYTAAFRNCIAKAAKTGKSVWIPAGTFKITGDILLPSTITVQGAGMWYTQLVGDDRLYADVNRRVRLKGTGSNIHISDFAITGKLNYRNDKEANDGIVGSYGKNSTISRIWIEHTKVGLWIENSKNLHVTGCRMRNTNADGINFCVGVAESTIENCTVRGTGDDCIAIWPATFLKQEFKPGRNLILHCTAQLPFLANGVAVYGGESNTIKSCSIVDISLGSGILISTTFPTESKDKGIHNNFTGTTVIENCDVKTSGGFDHEWDWRAAVEICIDKNDISGLDINKLNIVNSLSNAINVIAKNENGKVGFLSNTTLQHINIANFGIGTNGYALFINGGAHGSLTIKQSDIKDIKNTSNYFTIVR